MTAIVREERIGAAESRGYMPVAQRADWGTPLRFFLALDAEFRFDLDVCASDVNTKVSGNYYTPADDALVNPWAQDGPVCWMNPPYGREIPRWVQKAWDEAGKGATVVCLLPARTDTRWWAIFWDHDHHRPRHDGDEVRFIKGRLRFEGAEASAPFPSVVVVMRPRQGDMFGHHEPVRGAGAP